MSSNKKKKRPNPSSLRNVEDDIQDEKLQQEIAQRPNKRKIVSSSNGSQKDEESDVVKQQFSLTEDYDLDDEIDLESDDENSGDESENEDELAIYQDEAPTG